MRGHDLFRYAALVACLLCYITIILGGNVMASGDGLGCASWPACAPGENFLPHVSGAAAVEWSHRIAAFFLSTATVLMAVFAIAFERNRPVLLRASLLSVGLVVAQALLGGLVVESGLTVGLVLAHLALATLLFGLLLIIVLLANLRDVPRRWLDWARRAAEESPEESATPGFSEPSSPSGAGHPGVPSSPGEG